MKIHEILNKKFQFEKFGKNEPKLIEVVAPLTKRYKRKDKKFEQKVFNYFLKNKDTHGVKKIFRLKNSIVDGAFELENGEIILLEIKFALNWVKCSQARLQFQRFFIEKLYDKLPIEKPKGSIIVFHHFSGDWGKKRSVHRRYLDGWNRFYEEENIFRGHLIKTDIVQLNNSQCLIPYPGNAA